MNEIESLREEIDLIDGEIVKLLNRRIEIVLNIRDCKNKKGLPVEDLIREENIISKLNLDQLDEEFIRKIYQVIFRYSKFKQSQVNQV